MRREYCSSRTKMLHVLKFFILHTDKDHPASSKEIIEYLGSLGLYSERKSIYEYVNSFNTFGLRIRKKGHAFYYEPAPGDFVDEMRNMK